MPKIRLPVFRALWAFATCVLLAVIFYESSRPDGSPALPDLSTWESDLGHFVGYLLLGFSALTALLSRRTWVLIAVVLGCTGYGALNELYQTGVPGRAATSGDVGFDLAGAVVGVMAAWLLIGAWERVIGRE